MDTDTTRRVMRAARTLLQWDQERFAKALKVGTATLKRFEAGYPISKRIQERMQKRLRSTGVVIIDGGSIGEDEVAAGVALLRGAFVGEAAPLRSDAGSEIRKKGRRRPPEATEAAEGSDVETKIS